MRYFQPYVLCFIRSALFLSIIFGGRIATSSDSLRSSRLFRRTPERDKQVVRVVQTQDDWLSTRPSLRLVAEEIVDRQSSSARLISNLQLSTTLNMSLSTVRGAIRRLYRFNQFHDPVLGGFTPRELEVLERLATRNYDMTSVAEELGIKHSTVLTHFSNAAEHLGIPEENVKNVVTAALQLLGEGLQSTISPEEDLVDQVMREHAPRTWDQDTIPDVGSRRITLGLWVLA